MSKRWYVVHAYSGMEKSVARALQERVDRSGMADKFGRILVPTEEVVEMRNGQRTITERRFFPGYVLVEMVLDDDTWHLVKHTNKVTGFVGGAGNRPSPISDKEVEKIMAQMQEGVEKPRPKTLFEVGEMVRVKARSPTSTAMSRKSITTRAACGCRSPFLAVPRQWNSSSARLKRSDPHRSKRVTNGAARRTSPAVKRLRGSEERK